MGVVVGAMVVIDQGCSKGQNENNAEGHQEASGVQYPEKYGGVIWAIFGQLPAVILIDWTKTVNCTGLYC
jgi:hypothetical protein